MQTEHDGTATGTVREVARDEQSAAPPAGFDRLSSRTWLHAMYVDAHASAARISSVVGVSVAEVEAALRSAGIERRQQPGPRFERLRDASFMVDALAVRRLSLRALAREIGCSEQTVGAATRAPGVAEALAAAGWTRGRRADGPHGGRPLSAPLPSLDALVTTVASLSVRAGGWVTRGQLLEALDIDARQYHSLATRLEALVAEGRLVVTAVPTGGRGRPPRGYRPVSATVPAVSADVYSSTAREDQPVSTPRAAHQAV